MADSREEGGALTVGGAFDIIGSLKNAAYSAVADSTAVAVATSAVDSLTLGGLTARPSEDGPAMTTEAYSKLPTPEKGSSGEVSDEMKKHLAFMDEKFEAVLKEFDAPKDATKLTEICDNGFTNVRHLPYELAGPGVFSVNYTLERPGLTPMEVNEQLWPDSRVKDGKMFRTGVKLRSYQGTDGAITEVHGAILGVPGGVNLFVSNRAFCYIKHSVVLDGGKKVKTVLMSPPKELEEQIGAAHWLSCAAYERLTYATHSAGTGATLTQVGEGEVKVEFIVAQNMNGGLPNKMVYKMASKGVPESSQEVAEKLGAKIKALPLGDNESAF